MEHTWLCLLVLLTTHFTSGHSQGYSTDITTSASTYEVTTVGIQTMITPLPTATLTVNPNPVYAGEKLTLTCSAGTYSDWTGHQCNEVTVTVNGYQPKATLSSDTQDVLPGDRVTLSCTVESSGWMFYWYRDRQDSTPVNTTDGSSYTFNPVSVSDGGQYWCRAGRGKPPYHTLYSDPVRINVTERPVAVLTLLPNWTQIFTGETVTLRCVILGGEETVWEYRYRYRQYSWNRNENIYYDKGPEYIISPANTYNNGPKPVLSVSPQRLNPGDSVTLRCEVKKSTGWRFFWYRVVPSDETYSNEPLSGYSTTEDSYTLNPAGYKHTGGYVCRAGRGDPVYYTDYSEPQFLWSGDLLSAVSLTVNPNRTQHFTSTSVSLSCENKDNSTGWRVMRYTEEGLEYGCSSNRATILGSICTFKNTERGDSGVYWCEFGSGQNSNAVNLTVTDGNVILESPPIQ
ncbi:hypothetical protein UPYG_G00159600 [Umbra pygmaea]|uniref:Ig-like domain-containing protein n=1 Tax=Umbra pygmaea TaxID=75934 RepID=A0ABD0WYY9_UMBPY